VSGEPIHIKDAADLSALITALREAKGWSGAELARRSGVTASTVSVLEAGRYKPTATTLLRLLDALGLDLWAFPKQEPCHVCSGMGCPDCRTVIEYGGEA
jgi:transcriptional regulator with XRE-family HTH domain